MGWGRECESEKLVKGGCFAPAFPRAGCGLGGQLSPCLDGELHIPLYPSPFVDAEKPAADNFPQEITYSMLSMTTCSTVQWSTSHNQNIPASVWNQGSMKAERVQGAQCAMLVYCDWVHSQVWLSQCQYTVTRFVPKSLYCDWVGSQVSVL